MQQLTNQDVQAFIEQLVTIGGINHLNKDMVIVDDKDEPQSIQDGDKVKAIQILHSGMIKDEDKFILNPFKMIEGNNPALTWFYSSRIMILATIVKEIILKLVELSVSKETESYDTLHLLENVSEFCDKQTIEELSKINSLDYFRIFYNKRTRTAEAQTIIFSDDLESQYKLRKKTLTAVRTLMRNLFKLKDDENTLSAYKYHATILNIPEIDAKLHVYYQVLEVLELPAKLINQDLRSEEFKKHLDNLEAYARMYAWFTAKTTQNKVVVNNNSPQGLPIRQDVSVPVIPIQTSVPTVPTPVPPAPVASSIPVISTAPMVPVAPVPPVAPPIAPPSPYGYPQQQEVVRPVGLVPPAPPVMAPQMVVTPMAPTLPGMQYSQQVVIPQQFGVVAPPTPPTPGTMPAFEKPIIKIG